MLRQIIYGLIILLHLVALGSTVAVLSVDVGSEWIKVAIVSPGVPMEIVLNKESKRKTPAAIGFRNGERFFGEDALNLGVRFPQLSYSYILPLLGQRANSSVVEQFKKRFPYYQIEEDADRGTVIFRHDAETSFSPEELMAMILQNARKDAEASVKQPVTEVVLTVPVYFSQAARRSLLSAAHMAGLKPLQLINDYLAVAINYGIFRRKDFNETAQNIIFYDMGASSTTAAIVSFSVSKGRDPDPQATVLGVGFDRTLGGLEMQLRLRDHLGKKFNEMKKTANDVFKNPRALAKLFKEAGRVKNVLSANVDHYAQVEGLLDDIDFRVQVTREQLEEMSADLFKRVANPINEALKASGLTMDLISQVVIAGAGTRVPKIQEILTSAVGTALSKNINADEAAAMGAVYKAADLSAGFKVKRFITKDAVLYPIQVVFERRVDPESPTETPSFKTVKRTLFGAMNPYPQKKLLTFNRHSQDFNFYVNYAELDHLSEEDIIALGSLNLTKVDLGGISTALEKMVAPGVEAKGVKAHFLLDDSGILNLSGADMSFEKTVSESEEKKESSDDDSTLSKLGSTISKLFSGDDGPKPDDSSTTAPPATEDASSTPVPPAASNDSAPVETPKQKVVVVKESLTVTEDRQDLPDLEGDKLKKSKKKLSDLDEVDMKRHRREGALDALESFILDTRMKLETSEFLDAGTESEREAISTGLSSAADWLEEDGSTAETADFESKLKELKASAKPIFYRVEENRKRPEALATLDNIIENSEKFLKAAINQSVSVPNADDKIFTEVEINGLSKVINETKEWKTKKEKEQSAVPLSQDPKLTVKALAEKMALLDREVKYLVNKAKIWKPKKPKEEAPKDNGTSSDSGNKTSKAEKIVLNTNDTSNATDKESVPLEESILKETLEEGKTVNENEIPIAASDGEEKPKSTDDEEEKEIDADNMDEKTKEDSDRPKKHVEL